MINKTRTYEGKNALAPVANWNEAEIGREALTSTSDSFTAEDFVQIFHTKPWDVAFEKGIALGELVFEILGVTPKSEGLAMSVFLVTRSSGSFTGGTSWVFRVTLYR